MILSIVLWIVSVFCFGVLLGGLIWERTIGREYDRCIEELLRCNRRLAAELTRRENKTRAEGDEWKDN